MVVAGTTSIFCFAFAVLCFALVRILKVGATMTPSEFEGLRHREDAFPPCRDHPFQFWFLGLGRVDRWVKVLQPAGSSIPIVRPLFLGFPFFWLQGPPDRMRGESKILKEYPPLYSILEASLW